MASGGLQIEQDLEFQRREWRWERAGRIVLWAFVAAALAGLFGRGPLSRTQTRTADGLLAVSYERLLRVDAGSEIRIHVAPGGVRDREAVVWLEAAYLQPFTISSIAPSPHRTEARGARIAYAFRVPEPERGARIIIHYKPTQVGRFDTQIGLLHGQAASVWQLVFP